MVFYFLIAMYSVGLLPYISFSPLLLYLYWTIDLLERGLINLNSSRENPFVIFRFFFVVSGGLSLLFGFLKADGILHWSWAQTFWSFGAFFLLLCLFIFILSAIYIRKLTDCKKTSKEMISDISIYLWLALLAINIQICLAYALAGLGPAIESEFSSKSFKLFCFIYSLCQLFIIFLTWIVSKRLIEFGTTILIITVKMREQGLRSNRTNAVGGVPGQQGQGGNSSGGSSGIEASTTNQVGSNTDKAEGGGQQKKKRGFKIPKYLKVITDGAFYCRASSQEVFLSRMERRKQKMEIKFGSLRKSGGRKSDRKSRREAKNPTQKSQLFGRNRNTKIKIIPANLKNSLDIHQEEQQQQKKDKQQQKSIITPKTPKKFKTDGDIKEILKPKKQKKTVMISSEQIQESIQDLSKIKETKVIQRDFMGLRRRSHEKIQFGLQSPSEKNREDSLSYISE